jgi:putative endonuclease
VTHTRLATGRRGEAIAGDYLAARGYRLHAANWRCPLGEIDIVAQDGDWLVLVEVRTRRGVRFGTPEESVGPTKQRKLARVAECYVDACDWTGPWRIDVVSVTLGRRGDVERVAHYPSAVGG